MKLKFSIHYRTQWGEQIVVHISYGARGGKTHTMRLPMQTADGDSWTAETAIVDSRQRPTDHFSYVYTLEDADGRELRREWHLVERTYPADTSKAYVMEDEWRDTPLAAHLYTSAYRHTTLQALTTPTADDQQAAPTTFRKTVLFQVSAPQLTGSQSVGILGSHPALGSWNPVRYLKMQHVGQGEWRMAMNVDWMSQNEIEYKYVVVDEEQHQLVAWEEGSNRLTRIPTADGEVSVAHGGILRTAEQPWRAAGVCIPVSALRSSHSCGTGDFKDLTMFIDWAEATGMKIVQLLPLGDTTTSGIWTDAQPYNLTSAFALHPHCLSLEMLGELSDKKRMNDFRRQQRELNALQQTDYEAVERVKREYIKLHFEEFGEKVLESADYKEWEQASSYWIGDTSTPLYRYTQYQLHKQLKAAADYAHAKGIALKADLPIGLSKESDDVKKRPQLFHLDSHAGTPPDNTSRTGQNWGFPTYNWEAGDEVADWMERRLHHLEQYFDALRIDHVLGYFRIWEIPEDQLTPSMGHFAPSLPFTPGEIEHYGLKFRRDFLTQPFVNDGVIAQLFGIHASYVKETFLTQLPYGLYKLNDEVATQQLVARAFEGKGDENSLWIRDGLTRLVANVLFIEDPRQRDMYHPRIQAYLEPVYEALTNAEREAYMRLYNNYFHQRHGQLWGRHGYETLGRMAANTSMLLCGEDLGLAPECVRPVLDALRILTLEVQRMPKHPSQEFTHLDGTPIRSVSTISTHDMPPLRLWWEESPDRTQRYWTTMLQKQGRAPEQLPPHVAEEIIARHLYSPSMLCIFMLQDWLAIDTELRAKQVKAERINTPGDTYNRWDYRMHINIEQLLEADRYNTKLRTMIKRSKR